MPTTYLDRLVDQREQFRATAQQLLDGAVAEDRDVTDAEQSTIDDCYAQIATLDERLEPIQAAELRQAAHDSRVAELDIARRGARNVPTQRQGEPDTGSALAAYRTVGDYLLDCHAIKKGDGEARARIGRVHAEMRSKPEFRAIADQLLGDNPGLLPEPILGPLYSVLNTSRPFLNSVTQRQLPGGCKVFSRPKVTQHTIIGEQTVEKTLLASQKMTIVDTDVTKRTFGGTLDISFQDRDWTEPSILNIAIEDLFGVYAGHTDNVFADLFVAGATGTQTLAAGADYAATLTALFGASAKVLAQSQRYPDTVWLSVDQWQRFGSMVGPMGQQVFPTLTPSGQQQGSVGFKTVVDANFAAGTCIVGNSGLVEFYEQAARLLSVTEVTILGFTIAVYGYAAFFIVDPAAFIKMGP